MTTLNGVEKKEVATIITLSHDKKVAIVKHYHMDKMIFHKDMTPTVYLVVARLAQWQVKNC